MLNKLMGGARKDITRLEDSKEYDERSEHEVQPQERKRTAGIMVF